jgi:DNA mismatch repair ATPase MutL
MGVSAGKMKVFQQITKLSYDKFTYLSKELLEDVRVEGIITKLNTIKGKTLLLNVNSRIVENAEIIKMVEKAYSECYQSIHEENEGFFVYLAVDIDPRKIDCNQHPSKKIVGFFSADKIY